MYVKEPSKEIPKEYNPKNEVAGVKNPLGVKVAFDTASLARFGLISETCILLE
jgi:hypothetical protein